MSLRFWNPASLRPMRLLRIPKPFDHSDWIFEPKMDGFRALAHVAGYRCTLLSRNGIPSGAGPQLHEEIAHSIRAYDAILDGEIAGLEPDGRSNFRSLLFRRQWPFFLAFDLLMLEGQDLRRLPLIERKRRRAASCRAWRVGFGFWITSRHAESICFRLRAIATWKESWESGAPVDTPRTLDQPPG